MVTGQRGGSRLGLVVVGLLALGAVDACGSRSPLIETFEGVAGEGETGGFGGSTGGSTGGDGDSGGFGGNGAGGDYPIPGTGAYPGQGGAYPATGGAYPGAGGAYPGAGGAYPGAGGADPMPVGGAYPGFGGVGVGGAYVTGGIGGAYVTGGVGGKGMGAGGKGMGAGGKGSGGTGGKGDIRVYKGCLLACQKYESLCPLVSDGCLDECVLTAGEYPQCSDQFADWLFCLDANMTYGAMCSQDTCDGPTGCLSNAQQICDWAMVAVSDCILPPNPPDECYASGELSEDFCHIDTFCGSAIFRTQCVPTPQTGAFECTCSSGDEAASTILFGTGETVCYAMEDACGFPSILGRPEPL